MLRVELVGGGDVDGVHFIALAQLFHRVVHPGAELPREFLQGMLAEIGGAGQPHEGQRRDLRKDPGGGHAQPGDPQP